MKKILIYSLLIGLISCGSDSLINDAPDNIKTNVENQSKRSQEDAIYIALDASKIFQGNVNSRNRNISVANVKVISSANSRSQNDTAMYVVNFADNEGYALIAASEQIPPILAITDRGNIENPQNIENPGLKEFFDNAILYSSDFESVDPMRIEIVELRDSADVSPRVNVTWGQTGGISTFCPNDCVGCSPLAAAMAMSYLRYPTSLNLTFPNAPVDSVYLNWNMIIDGIDTYSLALLCREIGYRMSTSYSYEQNANGQWFATSGTLIDNIKTGLDSILPNRVSNLYGGSTSDFEISPVSYIRNSGVLVANGYNGYHQSGHTFVVDGLHYYYYRKDIYRVTMSPGSGLISPGHSLWELVSSTEEKENLIHINWGWYGIDNGYFKGDLVVRQMGVAYDQLTGSTPQTFNFYKSFYVIQ